MDATPLICILGLASGLALLIICPSRAGMWKAIRLYASDHEEANLLIDKRRAERKSAIALEVRS